MDEKNQLRKFEKDVLNYYMRFGYSTETKKKKYLIDSKTNMSKKKLNKDLQILKDNFIDGKKKVLAIGFKRK
jgi:hypothetical protein